MIEDLAWCLRREMTWEREVLRFLSILYQFYNFIVHWDADRSGTGMSRLSVNAQLNNGNGISP